MGFPLMKLLERLRSPPTANWAAATKLIGFATWIPVIACFNLYVAELTTVNGSSMYPLINTDKDTSLLRDVVFNWKWQARERLERGMIVTLRSPTNPNVIAIKRIVAMEGDELSTKAPYPVSTAKVPRGHVWVEGDGPPGSSLDSNTYGPVSKMLITGTVTGIVYPFHKFGSINWRDYERPLLKTGQQ